MHSNWIDGFPVGINYRPPTASAGARWLVSWYDNFAEQGKIVTRRIGFYDYDTEAEMMDAAAQMFCDWWNTASKGKLPSSIDRERKVERYFKMTGLRDDTILKVSLTFKVPEAGENENG